MQKVWNMVRRQISGDKCRYAEGGFDLDLTYITDRIIAMSFPAEGVESTFRNNIDQVAELLHSKHPNHFMIYNVSEREYDTSKFGHRVQSWCGFPDHQSPPLSLLFRICLSIDEWLSRDEVNVAVVHCLAGKGRTGTVIAAYFVFTGLFDSAEEALNYYAAMRSSTCWGVTNPSQRRYVQYLAEVIHHGMVPQSRLLVLRRLTMVTIPNMEGGGCRPRIEVFAIPPVGRQRRLLYTNKASDALRAYSATSDSVAATDVNVLVCGDLLVKYTHQNLARKRKMFYFYLHTGMLTQSSPCVSVLPTGNHFEVRLHKSKIDGASQDKRFANNFHVVVLFEEFGPAHTDSDNSRDHGIAGADAESLLAYKEAVEDEALCWQFRSAGPPDGARCFTGSPAAKRDKVLQARRRACLKGTVYEKAGWLTKQGHQVKNWKLRWFHLKDNAISYFRKPRDTTPLGRFPLDEVWAVTRVGPTVSGRRDGYCFEIVTGKKNYLITTDSVQEMEEWMEAILEARNQLDEQRQQARLGTLHVQVAEARDLAAKDVKGTCNPYCTITLEKQKVTTPTVFDSLNPSWDNVYEFNVTDMNSELRITIWDKNLVLFDDFMGMVTLKVADIAAAATALAANGAALNAALPAAFAETQPVAGDAGLGPMIDAWFKLKKRNLLSRISGELRLLLEWVPTTSEPGRAGVNADMSCAASHRRSEEERDGAAALTASALVPLGIAGSTEAESTDGGRSRGDNGNGNGSGQPEAAQGWTVVGLVDTSQSPASYPATERRSRTNSVASKGSSGHVSLSSSAGSVSPLAVAVSLEKEREKHGETAESSPVVVGT